MMDESLKRQLNDIVKEVNKQKAPKEQPIDGGFRNQRFYENMFKQMNEEEAFEVVGRNIIKKTWIHEPEVAIRTFERFYGVPFESKIEREKHAVELENERLKAELEAMRAQKAAEAAAVAEQVVDEEKKPIDFTLFPKGMSKDEFKVFFTEWFTKSQGVKPNGGQQGSAWNKYLKANENTEV